jgi:hypothetical protein
MSLQQRRLKHRRPTGWLVLTILFGLKEKSIPFWRPGNGFYDDFKHKDNIL